MKLSGVVVETFPEDQSALIFSSGLSKKAIVSWNSVCNCRPKRLDVNDVLHFDFASKDGQAKITSIRILVGKEESYTRRRVESYRRMGK